MIHLTNIKPMGRYRNIQTNQTVNVKKGRRVGRATDVMFFERNGHLMRSWHRKKPIKKSSDNLERRKVRMILVKKIDNPQFPIEVSMNGTRKLLTELAAMELYDKLGKEIQKLKKEKINGK